MTEATTDVARQERHFVLAFMQPVAPIFASGFATHSSHTVCLIGIASAVGAGISMAFSEGLSDDGTLTGRGSPIVRGIGTGLVTALGGLLHTLPFLISKVQTALTLAYVVVGIELIVIALIRYRYFATNFWLSIFQVVVGGALVFAAGVLIGRSQRRRDVRARAIAITARAAAAMNAESRRPRTRRRRR